MRRQSLVSFCLPLLSPPGFVCFPLSPFDSCCLFAYYPLSPVFLLPSPAVRQATVTRGVSSLLFLALSPLGSIVCLLLVVSSVSTAPVGPCCLPLLMSVSSVRLHVCSLSRPAPCMHFNLLRCCCLSLSVLLLLVLLLLPPRSCHSVSARLLAPQIVSFLV